ncbi:hypothetical protein [Dactylosporangium sp. NPDC048998]
MAVPITNPDDERLSDYRASTDVVWRQCRRHTTVGVVSSRARASSG